MIRIKNAADAVNKLSIIIIREKTINPLISDELVSTINTSVIDANNALALTLIALK